MCHTSFIGDEDITHDCLETVTGFFTVKEQRKKYLQEASIWILQNLSITLNKTDPGSG